MLKIMTVVGTRPEIIKLSLVISELDKNFNHILVHTGQNYDYELNKIFFEDLEIREPDEFLKCSSHNPAENIGNIISRTSLMIEKHNPDVFLIYGDTNSCLSVIAAKRKKIPIFHMEAGNRCFDMRVPEEINRRIVDHTSDINMTITEHGRRYLISEGIKAETIFKIGSSMFEVINRHRAKVQSSDILTRLNLLQKQYFVVSIHREENVDNLDNYEEIIDSVNRIAEQFGLPIIFSIHPRLRNKLNQSTKILNPLINAIAPLGYIDYLKLQTESFCVVSDSGTIFEESVLCKFPAVTIRESHERPEGIEAGGLVVASPEETEIIEAIKQVTSQHLGGYRCQDLDDYSSPDVSKKVSRIISSYTSYVNRITWRKD